MEKISFQIENEQKPVDFFVLEQTRIAGINYLLVTEEEEGDSEAFILKDLSNDEDNDSIYEIVSDDKELDAVAAVFENMLDDIELQKEDN